MKEFVIDLFCGAGGTSTGIHLANCDTTVTACVNHDAKAIESHRRNHPWAKHFIEDIRNPEVVFFLKLRVDALRKIYPDCIITIWASLECTNFSKAKGGLPRDADSRTLANHLFMYLDVLNPDYLMIENVEEFMSWGPLDEKGKPVSKKRGEDYIKWVDAVKSRGFEFDYRLLNAADFGAYTSRKRYFAQFAKNDLPIHWPRQTHAKHPEKEKAPFKKWKAVKEVLNFQEEGISIFNRKKPLVENTLKRIYAGLLKFVANGDESFIQKNFSGRPWGKVVSVEGPAGTILTNGSNQALVGCNFLLKYNSINGKTGKHIPPSVNEPCPTVAVQGRLGLTNVSFLQSYYGNGGAHSENEPCPTVSTKDRFARVEYFMMNYSSGQKVRSVDYPAGTIVGNDKHNLINTFLFNPQYKNPGNSVEKPCPAIIARQDKKPLGLVICDTSAESFAIPIYEDDTETMVKIKQFMAAYGIVDIKMRMLMVEELLRIQGFPKGYELVGNQTDKKKFIGNSVEVTTAKKLFEAHHAALVEYFELIEAV
ncbi:DNA cytosine methyltransferase [Aequorivita echinoideorum]|uniref:DNA (cytosine-5-)-methyltransferase n=1 Tax=Aequorivita echinoideorum TaxID=1549647 RepID=A0ABS5S342_9FLAO|nr:DNA cytosine methyltransferase [Aequorivita echinoideorum]MBT0607624.1 DNA cytosine methyltransferase [Aequorivita echinoideorum]